jgi:trehalose-phosphatase
MTQEILAAITGAWRDAHLLLCCTMDGVLSDNGERPGDVRVPSHRRALLSSLASLDSVSVCVASGRRLAQVQTALGRDRRVYYVGLRGLEIEGPRLSYFHLGAARSVDVLTPLAAALHGVTRETPGMVVEYRNLHLVVRLGWVRDPGVRDTVVRRVLEFTAPFARTHKLRVVECGHDIEILPDVHWTTGDAIRQIKLTTERQFGRCSVVVIGNGLGEDDAFAAVRDAGLAVHVGVSDVPVAFRVRSQDDVEAILLGLVKLGQAKLAPDAQIAR